MQRLERNLYIHFINANRINNEDILVEQCKGKAPRISYSTTVGVKCLRYVNDHIGGDAVEPIPYVPPPVL